MMARVLLMLTAVAGPAAALMAPARRVRGASTAVSSEGAGGGLVQVRFRIHPDGRVEETVVGVKGVDCTKLTESINAKLGKVVDTQPTAEMFEKSQNVQVNEANGVYEQNYGEW
ncbi:hypothetical protein M885DRAFT_506227 [Pelagophyceae sp. CCMP2097]|nr:hypothetical protein M885DRAFT_506227 [Pelagophyceae sp. CCMP2097]|mmetsp:Transcript_15766/g.53115  ORF Transcript_15766/g.53115 Transcript_15766/m.53115 type:complete len:114 (+) Transcript_15766:53-394(+)